jgi:hypothetical protein
MRTHLLMVGLVVAGAGCGGSNIATVSGRVTLDDKPVPNAMVIFEPLANEKDPGPGSQGRTDQNGRFTLETMTGAKSGALVGPHRVRITLYEGEEEVPSSGSDMKFRRRIIPDEYNARSTLTFDVPPGGSTEANFDLKSRPTR